MIQHLFSDMDFTILNSEGVVTDKTATAVKSAGIPLTLVSARAPVEMMPAIKKTGIIGTSNWL